MGGPRVLVVGSVNLDYVVRVSRLPRAGETVTGGHFSRHMGGKGANQAVGAARLGASVALVAAVGNDDAGREALADLTAEGVDVAGCLTDASLPTGVAIIAVDEQGENQIAVAPGANSALDDRLVDEALVRLGGAVNIDACLASLEVADSAVLAGARYAHRQSAPVVVNAAPARALSQELVSMHPILVANAAEATALTGETNPGHAAAALARRCRAPAVVTLGAEGAMLAEQEREPVQFAAPAVATVDTTGAGDTFAGALATELASGTAPADATRFAVAAASLSTTRPGARGGMPIRSEVEALLAE